MGSANVSDKKDRFMKEGTIVVCPNKSIGAEKNTTKTGTIIQIVNNECLVLDAAGFIHRVRVSELYEAQE